MAELFKKIDDVRERALKTEQAITEMTADIKQLDNTKKNLTLSMTTLKRLQMLTTAYEQLKALSKSRQYRDCAQLLQAVIQLMSHFKSYRSIDQIATLSRNVADIQRELLEQVCEDFELIFAKGEIAQRKNVLSEGCLVMEALGDAAKTRLTNWYCNTQLREYRQETLDFEQSLDKHFTTASRASIDTFTSSESPAFSQSISEAFTPYLGVWVEAQDKQLATFITKYRQQPVKPDDEDFSPQLVIHSSTDLFTFYRHSLAQCAKLSTGNSLAELSKVFAKYLDQYAQQVLLYHISERASGQTPSNTPSLEELIMVLNTADYCYSTCSQLEEKIKGRVDENFKQTIDLQSQADSFMGIASAVVRTLVRKVEFELEPAWKEMRNTAWNKLDSVGDQSSYLEILLAKCKAKSEEILSMLHKQQYARTFADHLVEHISSSFISNIYQCRPVSETGAEQMLLDSYSLKNGLSNLLDPAPAGFTKRLNATFQKIDTLLKTLQVRASPAEALVQAYLIHIADKNDNNFRKLLDIKGIRGKIEQNRLLELFQIHKASDRYASNLLASNPIIAQLQPQSSSVAPQPGTAAQGLGLSSLANAPSSSLGASTLQTRFDATTFGSALISAARDGVDRLGTPALGNLVVNQTSPGTSNRMETLSPAEAAAGGDASESGLAAAGLHATNLNENLKNIGKFFRRDLGGLGGRFGRGGDEGSR
ncbi:conserved hypothetical protein [Uncinocarpus reesii 1704]|uniref:Vps53 N-terminal domain-containing protein n=1 Tax=Uncinocarpus reesii (strain UAMH 1704) TaxID=336963 RepID=C4JVS4_UNCRE|nr:uncharacterized protein UREG_06666 [Uncinocarpus reesii 1704]EEP81801.1 conserved hypothetical protein [Uncinocarpus reesii 1704]